MEYLRDPDYSSNQTRDVLISIGCLIVSALFLYLGFSVDSAPKKNKQQKGLAEAVQASTSSTVWDFKIRKDPTNLFTIRYPNYLNSESFSPGSARLKSDDKGIDVVAKAWDAGDVPGISVLYEDELKTRSESGTVSYKYLKDGDYFVLSGKNESGNIFYLKEVSKEGYFYSIETTYPEIHKPSGDAIVKSFSTFPEMNIVRLSGELVQGSSTYPVIFKLSVTDDGTVSGYYWYKKNKESNHINVSGKVSDKSPRTLTMVTGKGTEEWLFSSNSSGPLSMYSELRGKMLKYESNESRLAGNSPTKEYTFTLNQ